MVAMSKVQFAVIVLLLVGILGFGAVPVVARAPSDVRFEAQRWEYKIDAFMDENTPTKLDELGAQGWEIVFERRVIDGAVARYEFIFRRAK